MNYEDGTTHPQVGHVFVVADHSHTDRQQLFKAITRMVPNGISVSGYAHVALNELRNAKPKSRHEGKRVYVVQIVEAYDVDPSYWEKVKKLFGRA